MKPRHLITLSLAAAAGAARAPSSGTLCTMLGLDVSRDSAGGQSGADSVRKMQAGMRAAF